jgi:hypothetical protein
MSASRGAMIPAPFPGVARPKLTSLARWYGPRWVVRTKHFDGNPARRTLLSNGTTTR